MIPNDVREFAQELLEAGTEATEERGWQFDEEETERRADGRRYLVYDPPREPGQPQVRFVLPEKNPDPV